MEPVLRTHAPSSIPGARPLRVVWERALELAVEVFRAGDAEGGFDPQLRQKLRSAALEVPTSLARALGRGSSELRTQLITALGALAELESHLLLAARLRPGSEQVLAALRPRLKLLRRLIIELGSRQGKRGMADSRAPASS